MPEFDYLTRLGDAYQDILPKLGDFSSQQGSHAIGSSFWSDIDLFRTIADAERAAGVASVFGPDNAPNGLLLPSTVRGGETTGAAVHNGSHVNEFNQLVYDTLGTQPKYLNRLEAELNMRLSGVTDFQQRANIAHEYRIKAQNFIDFTDRQYRDIVHFADQARRAARKNPEQLALF